MEANYPERSGCIVDMLEIYNSYTELEKVVYPENKKLKVWAQNFGQDYIMDISRKRKGLKGRFKIYLNNPFKIKDLYTKAHQDNIADYNDIYATAKYNERWLSEKEVYEIVAVLNITIRKILYENKVLVEKQKRKEERAIKKRKKSISGLFKSIRRGQIFYEL